MKTRISSISLMRRKATTNQKRRSRKMGLVLLMLYITGRLKKRLIVTAGQKSILSLHIKLGQETKLA